MVLSRALLVAVFCLVAAMPGGSRATPAAGASRQVAGSLRGRVEIGHTLSPSRPAPHTVGAGDDEMDPTTPEAYLHAVVFFDPPPERLERPSEARARMDQRNERFIPHLLAIEAGTVVDFPNDDRIYHNVFSLSKTKRFDLGRYAAGRSKAVRFDKPGIVRVFCEIHSHMNAFILVFDHRFFALTDAQGRFRIDRVPPGTYKVTAWYEGVAQKTQTVTIPPSAPADVTFALQ